MVDNECVCLGHMYVIIIYDWGKKLCHSCERSDGFVYIYNALSLRHVFDYPKVYRKFYCDLSVHSVKLGIEFNFCETFGQESFKCGKLMHRKISVLRNYSVTAV